MECGLSVQKSEPLFSKATNWYFQPRTFEKRLYEILGVNQYKKYFWEPTWGKLGKLLKILDSKWIKDNSTVSLENYIEDTKRGECWHLAYAAGVYYFMGFTPEAHVVNTIGNYYPIMIQRYNRTRTYNIIRKREIKKQEPDSTK